MCAWWQTIGCDAHVTCADCAFSFLTNNDHLHTSVWSRIKTTLLYLGGVEKEIYTSNCNILFKGSINFMFEWDLRNLCRGGLHLRRVRYIGCIDWSRNRTLCSEGTPIICQTPTCLTEPLQIYEKYMSIPLCDQVISTLVVLFWYFIFLLFYQ